MNQTYGDEITGFLSEPGDVQSIIEKRQEDLRKSLTIENLVDAQKKDLALYEDTNHFIAEQKEESVAQGGNRESYESACSLKLQLLYSMARRFHPRCSYGRRMLDLAGQSRREFEETIGAYTVWLTGENTGTFHSVLSPDIAEDISCGKSFGIGAVRSNGNKAYGVGAIAGEIAEDGSELFVRWLFVDEDFRGRGVAHSLIGELIDTANKNRIRRVTFETSLGNEWLLIFGFLLNEWRFVISTGLFSEAVIDVSGIKKPTKLAAKTGDAKDIEGVDVKKYLRSKGYRGFLLDATDDYIDPELSCCYGKKEAPTGLLLAHRLPSGRVRAEYVDGENETITTALTCYFALSAKEKCEASAELIFPVTGKDAGQILDTVFEKQRGMYMVRGTLLTPTYDIDTEDVDQLLRLSDEQLKDVGEKLLALI